MLKLRAVSLASTFGSAAPAELQGFLDRNCVVCHSGAAPQAGLNLREAASDLSDRPTRERWVRIHDRVRDGEMPPAGMPPPDAEDKATFLAAVAESIVA